MSTVDYLFIAVVTLSVFIGFFRGFMREAVSLASWALAVWVAMRFAWVVQPWLAVFDDSQGLQLWVARGVLFVGVLVAGALLNHALAALVRGTGLTGTDRMLGMLFGLGRGALVIGVLVIAGQFAGFNGDPWWGDSALMPYGERLADGIREVAGQASLRVNDLANGTPAE
jgi:membrane protein required for colicin V production